MTEERQKNNRIAFCLNDIEDVPATTRGAQATLSSLDAGFGVSCSVYPSSGTYTSYPCGSYFYKVQAFPGVATDYYWPETDSKMAFYAYYPYNNSNFTVQSAATANGSPTYAYTVSEAIASQVDVMTTQVVDRLASNHTAVPLTFSHRCTDIRFTAYNQQSDPLTVKSVAIYGVQYSGTYTNGTSWSLSGSRNSSSSHPFLLSLNTAVASKATVDLTGTTNHFIMLPQTVPNGTDFLVIKTGHGQVCDFPADSRQRNTDRRSCFCRGLGTYCNNNGNILNYRLVRRVILDYHIKQYHYEHQTFSFRRAAGRYVTRFLL